MDNEAPQGPQAAPAPRCWSIATWRDWKDQPHRVTPVGVRACECDAWTLTGYPAGSGGPACGARPLVLPFRCGSWRCRRCAWGVGVDDADRIAAALHSRPSWWWLVLTFDPAAWPDRWSAYRHGGYAWTKGIARWIRRTFVDDDGQALPLDYVVTWERTARGWPHANVVFHHRGVDDAGDELGLVTKRIPSKHKAGVYREATYSPKLRQAFIAAGERAGLGRVTWMEKVATSAGLAAYIAKTAMELAYGPEKDQTPVNAPPGFRRLRASRGILAPRPGPKGENVMVLDTANGPDQLAALSDDQLELVVAHNWTSKAAEAQLGAAAPRRDRLATLADLTEPLWS